MAKAVAKSKTVTVEKIETKPVPEPTYKKVEGRVSGSHRVKFQPTGQTITVSNGKVVSLGSEVKMIAATTAQTLVDKGLGVIIE